MTPDTVTPASLPAPAGCRFEPCHLCAVLVSGMASSMLVACAKCESLPTSITFFSTDDFAHTAAANLCASCAGQVAFNRCNLQRLVKQGWKVGSTRLRKRPRRLVIDPRWKEKPTLAHECVRFIMRNMDLISAKQVVQALPEYVDEQCLAV